MRRRYAGDTHSAAMRFIRVAGLDVAGVRYGMRAQRHYGITGW